MSTLDEYWTYFSSDYAGARVRFRSAALRAGATLDAYVHPTQKGPGGEELAIDVARLGPQDADRVLLVISGTHGLEGFAGSAIQTAYLLAHPPLPAHTALVFVHALNPYGFAYTSRTTENNVDLNRNFIDHEATLPENLLYAQLHPWITPDKWTQEALEATESAYRKFQEKHGPDGLFHVLVSGQYTHPDGLMYGGSRREWSNLTLQTIVDDHLAAAAQVAVIDLHTGIGAYGEPFFLCFHETDSAAYRLAQAWWGEQHIAAQRPHGLSRPAYHGLVVQGLQHFLGDRRMVAIVLEFGTRGDKTGLASRLDLWLRWKAPQDPDSDRDSMLRADMIDAMTPIAGAWRRSVLRHGWKILAQSAAGLATWAE